MNPVSNRRLWPSQIYVYEVDLLLEIDFPFVAHYPKLDVACVKIQPVSNDVNVCSRNYPINLYDFRMDSLWPAADWFCLV
jgi:hypothetical protein